MRPRSSRRARLIVMCSCRLFRRRNRGWSSAYRCVVTTATAVPLGLSDWATSGPYRFAAPTLRIDGLGAALQILARQPLLAQRRLVGI
jgi:hypothetical protein